MSISALKDKFNSLTLESENHWDYRGNNNSERDYVHGFCTYPAMMVPKMQREMLEVCLEHLQDRSPLLLDPFAGSGTILVEAMLKGLNVVGIDINPLAILLCKAKTTILNRNLLQEKTDQLFNWVTVHDQAHCIHSMVLTNGLRIRLFLILAEFVQVLLQKNLLSTVVFSGPLFVRS